MKKWLGLFSILAAMTIAAVIVSRFTLAFDPVAWRDEVQVQQGVRLGMADRLVARRMLLGKTREEVVELLGEPDTSLPDWDMAYNLGTDDRGFIFPELAWLVLRLGKDERVVQYRIERD